MFTVCQNTVASVLVSAYLETTFK